MSIKDSTQVGSDSRTSLVLEPKEIRYRPRTLLTLLIVAASLAVAVFLISPAAVAAKPASRLPHECLQDPARTTACELIFGFFAAVNAGRAHKACSLLGHELRQQTGGANCPTAVAFARGTPFQIVGACVAHPGVVILVKVGIYEFDHFRMLSWAAYVGREAGQLRILDTRRV